MLYFSLITDDMNCPHNGVEVGVGVRVGGGVLVGVGESVAVGVSDEVGDGV